MKIIKVLPLFFLIYGCSPEHSRTSTVRLSDSQSSDIVNGKIVNYRSKIASKIVYISTENALGFDDTCTGTFISNKFIITAQHCLSPAGKDGLSVVFRRKDYKKTGNVDNINIKNTYTLNLPGYTPSLEKIALIEFTGGLPKYAEIAKIPDLTFDKNLTLKVFQKMNFIAVGYGKSIEINKSDANNNVDTLVSDGSNILRYKHMTSGNIYQNEDTFMIDQALNNGGICSGDSGGPAFRLNKFSGEIEIIGVASSIVTPRFVINPDPEMDCKNQAIYLNTFYFSKKLKKIIQSGTVD